MQRRKTGDQYAIDTATAYYRTFGQDVEIKSELDRFFLGLIPDSLHGKVALDLGAGNGSYSEILHHKGAERVIAYDLSESMLDQAKERKQRKQLERLDVVQGDMENIPFGHKEIDFIFSRFSVMYACDLTALIRRLGEVLTDQGEMLILANFATIKEMEEVIKAGTVPLNLKIGENSVSVKNYPNTLNDYCSAFENAGFSIEITQQFPADELSVDAGYPHAGVIDFNYVVFHLRKKVARCETNNG
jgi:SAM-dependent methyltransferase